MAIGTWEAGTTRWVWRTQTSASPALGSGTTARVRGEALRRFVGTYKSAVGLRRGPLVIGQISRMSRQRKAGLRQRFIVRSESLRRMLGLLNRLTESHLASSVFEELRELYGDGECLRGPGGMGIICTTSDVGALGRHDQKRILLREVQTSQASKGSILTPW